MIFGRRVNRLPRVSSTLTTGARRNLGGLVSFQVPPIRNEPNVFLILVVYFGWPID